MRFHSLSVTGCVYMCVWECVPQPMLKFVACVLTSHFELYSLCAFLLNSSEFKSRFFLLYFVFAMCFCVSHRYVNVYTKRADFFSSFYFNSSFVLYADILFTLFSDIIDSMQYVERNCWHIKCFFFVFESEMFIFPLIFLVAQQTTSSKRKFHFIFYVFVRVQFFCAYFKISTANFRFCSICFLFFVVVVVAVFFCWLNNIIICQTTTATTFSALWSFDRFSKSRQFPLYFLSAMWRIEFVLVFHIQLARERFTFHRTYTKCSTQ